MLEFTLHLLICFSGCPVVHLLFAPSYVSNWTDVNVELGDGLVNVFNHGFGEYPVKADVQVMSDYGIIYPGVNTAQADESSGIRAGVICKYNTEQAVLYAPRAGLLINTGTWGSYTGKVRVRLWLPSDFPTPSQNYSFEADTASQNNWWNISHGGSEVPQFALVRVVTNEGWMFEAVGSNMQEKETTHWGAVVYAMNNKNIDIFAPVNLTGGLVSVCGWGDQSAQNCLYNSGKIEVLVWHDLMSTRIFNRELPLEAATWDKNEIQSEVDFDVNTDLIFVTAKLGQNHFLGTGAVMSDFDKAGLVYAYYSDWRGSKIRLWFTPSLPDGTYTYGHTNLIRIGPYMARYWSDQPDRLYFEASTGNASINIWRGHEKPATSTTSGIQTNPTTPEIDPRASETQPTTLETDSTRSSTQSTTSVTDPTTFATQLTTSVIDPTGTETQPTTHAIDPTASETQLTTPVIDLTASRAQSAISVIDLTASATQPTTRVIDLTASVIQPTIPVMDPSASVTQPTTRVMDPSASVTQPTTRVIDPSASVTQPTTHVIDPTASVTQPTTHVTVQTTSAVVRPCNYSCPPSTVNDIIMNDTFVCKKKNIMNITEAIEVAEKIIANLTIPPKTTSKYTRTLECAEDKRSSSKVIGTIGLVIVITYAMLLVLPDTVSTVRFIYAQYGLLRQRMLD